MHQYDFDKKRMEDESTEKTSSYYWGMQYKNNLPIMRKFFSNLQNSDKPIMHTIKEIFNDTRKEFRETSIGIFPDMLAAAIFLHLSFSKEAI